MTQEKIIEGNKLIAEFMGLKPIIIPDGMLEDLYKGEVVWIMKEFEEIYPTDGHIPYEDDSPEGFWKYFNPQATKLYYNFSWDWLMPVIEKIESLRLKVPEYNVIEWFEVNSFSTICTIKSGLNHVDGETKSPYYYSNTVIGTSKIESIWLAIIEFIKWYNSKNE